MKFYKLAIKPDKKNESTGIYLKYTESSPIPTLIPEELKRYQLENKDILTKLSNYYFTKKELEDIKYGIPSIPRPFNMPAWLEPKGIWYSETIVEDKELIKNILEYLSVREYMFLSENTATVYNKELNKVERKTSNRLLQLMYNILITVFSLEKMVSKPLNDLSSIEFEFDNQAKKWNLKYVREKNKAIIIPLTDKNIEQTLKQNNWKPLF